MPIATPATARKISEFDATTLEDTDLLVVEKADGTVTKITWSQLKGEIIKYVLIMG